ncbi:MAG: arylsulfotransferase family protein [Solirubrobacteraceae bacterium]
MRRNALIILGVAVLVWGVLAIALGSPSLRLAGSGTSTSTASSGVSPACLPSTFDRSAALGAGTGVDVSPAPGSVTANPHTQISFLGAPTAEIRAVSVTGTRSGAHPGSLRGYSQGDGGSFVPDTPFDAGERVSVHATVGAGRRVAFEFRVDTPYPTGGVPDFGNPRAAPADYQSFATLPGAQVPILGVTVPDHDPAAGDILTTNGPGPGQYGPLIYTPQGRLVWFDRLPGGETAEDLSEQSYAGKRDLTWWRGRVLELGFGQGEDLVMNSSYQTVARVPGANGLHADLHDFQIAPRGVAYITAYNPIRCNLSPLGGARDGAIIDTAIQEIDIATGLVRWEWHSLDHIPASRSETPTATNARPWDWFHINSIDVEGTGAAGATGVDTANAGTTGAAGAGAYSPGDLFISARNTWAGYQLEGGSGRILWQLGGLKSSFKMGRGTETAWQHDGRILPDGEVTFFDDGSNPPIHQQSRAVRIALDFATHEARLSSSLTHSNPPLLAASQGNMQTLADGNTVVGYGGVPAISQFSPSGALLFDAHLPYEMAFYRAFRFPWSGRPASPPAALASLNDTGEETIVHASWNGATGVATWRVLAAHRTGPLSARATMPADGFESSTTLPVKYAHVAVQALDAAGHVLGTSHTVPVSSYAASLPG